MSSANATFKSFYSLIFFIITFYKKKNGDVREPNLILNPKLFVTRVPEKATVDSLNQFFTERAHAIDSKCSVLDVYIPKPFRGFAFITLSSPAVAKELIL